MAPLTKNDLIIRVVGLNPELPREVAELAVELFLEAMVDGLAEGREICLRGFGRFIPRFYAKAKTKRLGILFHPSPHLHEPPEAE